MSLQVSKSSVMLTQKVKHPIHYVNSLVITQNQTTLKHRVQLVDGSTCLAVSVPVSANHINLLCTMKSISQKEWNSNQILRKRYLVSNQKLCCLITDTFIGSTT